MDNDTIHELFINFENLIANEVRKTILHSDFYAKNVTRKPWPNGQGNTFTYPTYDRAGGAGFLPFEQIAAFGTGGNLCDIPATENNNYASTTRSATLHQASTNTKDFCLRELDFAWQIERQLAISVENMADNTRFNWGQELQRKYIELCQNKIIYTDDATTSNTWGATVPTNMLDWEILAWVYENLRYIAKPEDGAGVDEEGKVIFQLVGAYDAFNNLKLQDSNFRGDVLAAISGGGQGEGRTLLGSPGMPAGRTYRGFKFETIQFAPHYDFVDGEYIQRYPYKLEQKTNGMGLEVDETYRDALFTDVVIFTKSLFDHLVPAPPRNRNGYDWNAEIDWMGSHKWVKIPIDKVNNPDGAYGFWRSVYAYGPQLQRPDLGWVIRVQRCKPQFGKFKCATAVSV